MSEQWNIVDFKGVYKFANEVNMYREGNISDGDFLPQRLANGIYGQRQDDAYMVRIKLPAGELNIKQLKCIGELIEKHSDVSFANITTRQDIQLHFVSLKNISKVLLRLADVGLTTREACGNTVRNVTACPLAGQCEKEVIDVRPVLNETVEHFIRHPLTQFMPRKVKMSFSGCEADCAMSTIHDVGVVAVKKDDQIGYKVYAGGGLGHKPRKAILIEEFVTKDKLKATIESVITLHNRHSDRKRRAKSRIKFLVEKFGKEGFRNKYREVLREVSSKTENLSKYDTKIVKFCNMDLKDQSILKLADKSSIEINLDIGDVSVDQISQISNVMKKFSLTKMRTTQSQNLLLMNVATDVLEQVRSELKNVNISSHRFSLERKSSVVACPGDWTCRLGITSSRRLARKLIDGADGMKIHISGCHNGCAQPQLADIGLHGEARRKFGKLIPFYQMYFGGDGKQGGGFGLKGPEIPAARAEIAVKLVQRSYNTDHAEQESFTAWSNRKGVIFFTELLEDISSVTAGDLPFLLKDVDSENEFRVLQLGGGECAGISEETVASQLAEASYEKEYRDIFLRLNKVESAVDCAENMLRLVGKSILFNQGNVVGNELSEILSKLSSSLKSYPQISISFESFMADTASLRLSEDTEVFSGFSKRLDAWVESLVDDSNKVSIDEYLVVENKNDQMLDSVLDLSDESCPMHYIKARQALRSINPGKVLRVVVAQGEDERLVSESLNSVGFSLVKTEAEGNDNVTLYIEKPIGWKTEKVSADLDGAEVA